MDKNFIQELINKLYPGKRVSLIDAEQFQLTLATGSLAGRSIANGLYIGKVQAINQGTAYAGNLTLTVNDAPKGASISRIVKQADAPLLFDGVAFSELTAAYSGTEAAGTRLANLVFSGYKVTFA